MKTSITTLLVIAAAGGASVLSGAAYAAGQAYGPTPATGPTSSGGFSQVLATATRGSAGGTLSSSAGGTSMTVSIPPSTFAVPLQVTLSAPNPARLAKRNLARPGEKLQHVLAGVAVTASNAGGTTIRGRLSAGMISVTLTNAALHPGDRVVVWNSRSRSFAPVPRSRVEILDGKVTVRFNRPSEFVVLPAR